MKRKDLRQVNDDFSEFSLSSPATKIRRLDAELPPIIEEEVKEVPMFEQYEAEDEGGGAGPRRGIVIEELPTQPENDERAIVIFKPPNSPLQASPSNFSVTLSPGIRNQMMCTHPLRQAGNGATAMDENCGARNNCMAVVPWVPSQVPSVPEDEISCQRDVNEKMDAQEMETAPMEVEDSYVTFEPSSALNQGIHQWQQQHCMIPQLPPNTSTPILWFR